MIEQHPDKNDSLLQAYRQLGKLSIFTGIKPVDAIQNILGSDPKKQAAFLDGATEGQSIKEEEEIAKKV